MDAVGQLGALLRDAGLGGERHRALAALPGGWPAPEVLEADHRSEDARLAALLALFRDCEPTGRGRAEAAVGPIAIEALAEAGVLDADGEVVRARVMLNAISGVIVAGDPAAEWGRDFVTGISPSGKVLAYTTVRRPVATALDLGTGSGIQALLAARHAERVVAVDLNPRALELGRIGAALEGVENIEWVEGDWAEPVRGRQFDHVVCNPPFVISPDTEIFARDSALGGEGISRHMVAECSRVLGEGGFATVLCGWAHVPGDWETVPRAWVTGTGCDALIVHLESLDALEYAVINVTGRPDPDPRTIADGIERWTDYYAREGIERIALGVVVLRRRSAGSNWVRTVEAPGEPSGPSGEHVERMFAGGDFLAAGPGAEGRAALLASRWAAVDGSRLEQSLTYGEDGFVAGAALLRQSGLNVHAHVDARIAHVVLALDGRATVGDLIARAPVPADLSAAAFEELCVDAVTELIGKGFLTPA